MMISMTLRNKDAGIQKKLIRLQLTAEELDALTADFIPISVTVFCQIYLVAMHSTTLVYLAINQI